MLKNRVLKNTYQVFLDSAQPDLIAAGRLLIPECAGLACFHLQQAAEKYLKAMISITNKESPATHIMETLINEVDALFELPDDVQSYLHMLGRYYINPRYPEVHNQYMSYDNRGRYTIEEAKRMATSTWRSLNCLEEKIEDYADEHNLNIRLPSLPNIDMVKDIER
jgi:HEPN domain-containing protein